MNEFYEAVSNLLEEMRCDSGKREYDKVERRVLTVEEQEIFIEHLERTKSWYEEMYKLMLLTGMRIGEVGGLQW